jgi:hypothetical protein
MHGCFLHPGFSFWRVGLAHDGHVRQLREYLDQFDCAGIDLELLPDLSDEDLCNIGVHAFGDRRRVLLALAPYS